MVIIIIIIIKPFNSAARVISRLNACVFILLMILRFKGWKSNLENLHSVCPNKIVDPNQKIHYINSCFLLWQSG